MDSHSQSNAPIASYNHVARVVWNGSLPIQFTWSKAEAQGFALGPLLIEAPRCSYLSSVNNQICRHFGGKVPQSLSDVWYEYEGTPLKWHYPIGLLYDIHVLQSHSQKASEASMLPWKITVHFQDFPADKLIRHSTADSSQDYFMSMIKEAEYLRNGSTKKVMNMPMADQTQLWDGLWSKSYDLFWGMNHKLVTNDGLAVRHLPIRIYLPENCPVIQEPVSPVDENAQAIIHGITPNLDTSALWLAQNMAYPDNFLHLVVIIE
ncbi:autophagy protein 5 [Mortierella alpina]|nr:autophagy protein 5 [Mortierella alpina]